MEHHPARWGKPRADHIAASKGPIAHTQYVLSIKRLQFHNSLRQPIVTGTSVLAIKYKDGIMMASDCLGTVSSLVVCLNDAPSFLRFIGALP